jgi:pyruvate formate lyase activating enzyme
MTTTGTASYTGARGPTPGTDPDTRLSTLPDRAAVRGDVTGTLHSWDLSTGQDGPGTRLVFVTAGCPLACSYCHNPDTQTMRNGRRVTVQELLGRVGRYRPFLEAAHGGITISGGEPMLQPLFVEDILVGAHALGVHTALDTSGALGHRASDRLLGAGEICASGRPHAPYSDASSLPGGRARCGCCGPTFTR